jgi:hypothetical protein
MSLPFRTSVSGVHALLASGAVITIAETYSRAVPLSRLGQGSNLRHRFGRVRRPPQTVANRLVRPWEVITLPCPAQVARPSHLRAIRLPVTVVDQPWITGFSRRGGKEAVGASETLWLGSQAPFGPPPDEFLN